MNIFVLHDQPIYAAQLQCDRHVVKMVLETAQILCTAHKQGPYKPTHEKHPCTLWAGKSVFNYLWLVSHGEALSREYTFRYGKIHKSEEIIFNSRKEAWRFPDREQTEFVLAMPDECKKSTIPLSYRSYYQYKNNKWKRPMKWTNREIPTFMK